MKKEKETGKEACMAACRKGMKAALFFLGAGMAGATLALLYAPQSGKETRRAIRGAGEDLVDRAEAVQEDVSERVAALVGDALAIAEEGLDKGKGMTEKVHDDLISTLRTSKELINHQIERAQQLVHK